MNISSIHLMLEHRDMSVENPCWRFLDSTLALCDLLALPGKLSFQRTYEMNTASIESTPIATEGKASAGCPAVRLDVVKRRLNPMSDELKQFSAVTGVRPGSFGSTSSTSTH